MSLNGLVSPLAQLVSFHLTNKLLLLFSFLSPAHFHFLSVSFSDGIFISRISQFPLTPEQFNAPPKSEWSFRGEQITPLLLLFWCLLSSSSSFSLQLTVLPPVVSLALSFSVSFLAAKSLCFWGYSCSLALAFYFFVLCTLSYSYSHFQSQSQSQ